MRAVVVYASKYGFTKGIADFIADTIRQNGVEAVAQEADKLKTIEDHDAFVIGSAVFYGKWMKEAREFVTRNREVLASRPVWLFSSGPVGKETMDKQGHDLREASAPKDIAEFKRIINPRDHRVFYGGLDISKHLSLRILSRSSSVRAGLPDGDFRDWKEIEAWATNIAQDLRTTKDR
jgi:menaquinone-dependent protoporphyrinogen oxidase